MAQSYANCYGVTAENEEKAVENAKKQLQEEIKDGDSFDVLDTHVMEEESPYTVQLDVKMERRLENPLDYFHKAETVQESGYTFNE